MRVPDDGFIKKPKNGPVLGNKRYNLKIHLWLTVRLFVWWLLT